jgi:hypothetical protein
MLETQTTKTEEFKMPGQQRGKMKIPAGNANRRRMMCGGEMMAKGKKKTTMKGGGKAKQRK